MSKNKKALSRQRNSNIATPEVIDADTLSYTSDDDLMRRLDYLYSEKDKAYNSNFGDLTSWEVEICYVQRELGIRNSRKFLHEKFLRENQAQVRFGAEEQFTAVFN